MKKYSIEYYKNLGKETYGENYEYIRIEKREYANYLIIKCKLHDLFARTFHEHFKLNRGCPQCILKDEEKGYIEQSKIKHNNKYSYEKVIFLNKRDKVIITCHKHGDFEQSFSNHLNGQGCPKCKKNCKMTTDDFIERSKIIHKNKYTYDKTKYINIFEKVIITCPEHGDFIQKPNEHVCGYGCYRCAGFIRTTDDFIKKANIVHNNKYNYKKVVYESARKKITISCNDHGDFLQSPNDHLSGNGCQKCAKTGFSKSCLEWLENLSKKENIFIQHAGNLGEKSVIFDGKTYKLDGFCKENNTVYEFHGDLWHGNPKIYNSNDKNPFNKKTYGELYKKTIERENIIKTKYNLVTIWENDFLKNK